MKPSEALIAALRECKRTEHINGSNAPSGAISLSLTSWAQLQEAIARVLEGDKVESSTEVL